MATCLFTVNYAQQTIAAVKSLPPGSVVTTTGTLTSNEFGNLKYIQDYTAGIALYTPLLSLGQPGDSFVITGVISIYKDEIQIYPVNSFQLLATDRTIPVTNTSDFDFLSSSASTSQNVSVSCTAFQTCESYFDEGPYRVFDQNGQVIKVVVYDGSSLIGKPISTQPVELNGIWTYSNGQYQLLLQSVDAMSGNMCHLLPAPSITFQNNQVRLTANNFAAGTTTVQYGIEQFDQQIQLGQTSNVDVALENLFSGNIYQARLQQISNTSDTFYSPLVYLAPPSTGPPVEVFFNHGVDATYSDGSAPIATGSSAIEVDLISRIDQVQHTLDIAMYNTGRATFVQAVKRAKQRGVQIRYIADDETSNTALSGETSFPILYRTDDGIMHNKFVIADADDAALAWLWTGSTNWTSNQLSSDPNHGYVIHDQALAKNYRLEFDEMWGVNPAHNQSRTGEVKTDNTCHLFSNNGITIESYFSPSDEPDCHILEAVSSANVHVEIGLLLLTSGTLIDKIIELHHQGVQVRMILEDESSSTYAVARLHEEGVPLAIHTPSPIFHHKYAIVDEGVLDSDPLVVTGSHNWTFSADHINDENTLIVHDQSFTNIFRQEFEARWSELDPTAVHEDAFQQLVVYPNPASHGFYFTNPSGTSCTLSLFGVTGMQKEKYEIGAGETKYCPLAPNAIPGYYALKCKWPDHTAVTSLWVCPE